MDRPRKEVRGHERDHDGVTARVVAKIDEERVAVGHEAHRGGRDAAADLGRTEGVELDVADVPGEDADVDEGASALGGGDGLIGGPDDEMFVSGRRLKIPG